MDSFNTTPPENPDRFYNLELNNHVRYIGSSKSANGLEALVGRVCADGNSVVVEVSILGTVVQDVSSIMAMLEDEEGNKFQLRCAERCEGKLHSFFLSFYNPVEHTVFKANVLFRLMLIVSPNPSWYDDLKWRTKLHTVEGTTIDTTKSSIIRDFGVKVPIFTYTFNSDIIPLREVILDKVADKQKGLVLSSIRCSPTESIVIFNHKSLSNAVKHQSMGASILEGNVNNRNWVSRFGNWGYGDADRTVCVSEGYFYDLNSWTLHIQKLQWDIHLRASNPEEDVYSVVDVDTDSVEGSWIFQFEMPKSLLG